jgi:heme exporter protein C
MIYASIAVLIPSIAYCLFFAPTEATLGEVYRSIFFHIPCSWGAVLAFLVSLVFSILVLAKRKPEYDRYAHRSAEIGLLFSILATITGSIYAGSTWGSYWNWDPREISIVFLILAYLAYLGIRSAVTNPERRARVSAGYNIIAAIAMPFLVFAYPRIMPSLHPESVGGLGLPKSMYFGLFGMVVGITLMFVSMLKMAVRIDKEASC